MKKKEENAAYMAALLAGKSIGLLAIIKAFADGLAVGSLMAEKKGGEDECKK